MNNFSINNNQLNMMRMQQDARTRQAKTGPALETAQSPQGSLIIADSFTPSSHTLSHGELVGGAARQAGYKGQILTTTGSGPGGAEINAISSAQRTLSSSQSTPRDVLRAVDKYTAAETVALMDGRTKVLNNATAKGTRNSAINMSQGGSKAQAVDRLYGPAALAWNAKDPEAKALGQSIAGNYAKAFDLDMSKLESSDPKVSGPERAKLQTALSRRVDRTLAKHPKVTEAKQNWSQAVKDFESGNNSVVIPSGNERDFTKRLNADLNGQKVGRPRDFEQNLLETPEVTSVGATRWYKNEDGLKEVQSDYGSRGQGVDIYASGSMDTNKDGVADTFGTSFAAPRVAATMAELHKRNPGMSSSQVENLMRQQLTHNLETPGGNIEVLDYARTANFLSD